MSSEFELKKIGEARNFVRDAANETQVWGLASAIGGKLKFSRKGREYEELLENLGPEDMSFAYAKIIMGDEVSRRDKFILISWVGPDVSAVKRGKMMICRSEIDKIFDQRAIVIETSELSEVALKTVKQALVKVGGADYGTSTS